MVASSMLYLPSVVITTDAVSENVWNINMREITKHVQRWK